MSRDISPFLKIWRGECWFSGGLISLPFVSSILTPATIHNLGLGWLVAVFNLPDLHGLFILRRFVALFLMFNNI